MNRKQPLRSTTPLAAQTGLSRTSGLRGTAIDRTPRGPQPPQLARRLSARFRYTGPDDATRALVLARDGHACLVCPANIPHLDGLLEVHHRRPRAAGGSRRVDTNLPTNLITLHRLCHRLVERQRKGALLLGWLVRQGTDPVSVPLWLPRDGAWVLLTADGGYEPAGEVDRG